MTALRVFPGNGPAELAAPFSVALGRTSSRDNPLHVCDLTLPHPRGAEGITSFWPT
jgi:hypothetical protein